MAVGNIVYKNVLDTEDLTPKKLESLYSTLINDLNAFNYKRYTRENTQDLNRILRGLASHSADTEIINDTVKIYNESNGSNLTYDEIFRNKVSKYGASSKSEGFAELFAKVMNNDNDEITTIFKGVLDNKIRELK